MFTPNETLSAEQWVRVCWMEQIGRVFLTGPLEVEVEITVQVPSSWRGEKVKKAMAGKLMPTGKPDLDNTAKLLLDALNGIAWRDDAQVVGLKVSKRYGSEPETLIRVKPLSEPDAVALML